MQASQAQWLAALELAKKREKGACIQILADSAEKTDLNQIRLLAKHIEIALPTGQSPATI